MLIGVLAYRWWFTPDGGIGTVVDEALQASPPRPAASFPAADEDYFHDMDQTRDGPIALSPDEVKGRNTWIVWSAGNDRMWDTLGDNSAGALDFLKVLSSHPSQKYSRACDPARQAAGQCENRWEYFGLVNEPCFEKATGPDPNRFGLWLDTAEGRVRGRSVRERGEVSRACGSGRAAAPSTASRSTRAPTTGTRRASSASACFRTRSSTKPRRGAGTPSGTTRIRPTTTTRRSCVRIASGMSCGLCHVGPNPIKPPADPNNPEWANLSSNVGAQYFWTDRIFYQAADYSSFAFQLFHSSRPGSLDTSFVSTDNINNPRTMNAVYGLLPRLLQARRWGKETLAGGGVNNKQLNDYLKDGPLAHAVRGAAHGVDAARAQGRRPTRSASWAR